MGRDHLHRGGRAGERGRARRIGALAATVVATVVATGRPAAGEVVATPTPMPRRPLVAILHPLRRLDGFLSVDEGRTVGQARFEPMREAAGAGAGEGEARPVSSPSPMASPALGSTPGMDVRVELVAPIEAPADPTGAPVAIDRERRLQVVAGNCRAAMRGARGGLEVLGDFTSPADGRAGLQA
ncbi:MAG: hypothetical protein ACKO2K_14950, partial [Alphaproteobacteria bacterium]